VCVGHVDTLLLMLSFTR